MEYMPLVFSVVFCMVCAVSLSLGAYVFYLNPGAGLNRVFFALCVSLMIWTVGLGVALSAADLQTCLFWRRLSAVGWGSFFSIMLHTFLTLTGNRSLRKWWTYLFLYLPSAITMVAFTWFPGVNPGQYNMVHTAYGWTNVAVNNAWDWYYMAYYLGFSALGFALVWRWGRKSVDPDARKLSRLILCSFVPAMLLGSLTDILGNSLLSITLPQVAPIIMLMPLCFVYYAIRKYRFMDPRPANADDFLITDQIRKRIFDYLSLALLSGGLLNFISQYLFFDKPDLLSVLLFSGGLALAAIVLHVVQRLKVKRNIKDVLNTATIALMIPVITLRFVAYAALTVWAFPFIIIIISLIFSKRYILITVAASIFLTQIAVWIIMPQLQVSVDNTDYIARIGLFAIALWLAFFVNRVYISRLRENEGQISSQKLVSDISLDYVTVTSENLDEKTFRMLKRLGKYFDVDRAYILLFDTEKQWMMVVHCWNSEPFRSEAFIKMPVGQFPWLAGRLMTHEVLHIPDIDKLPPDAAGYLSMMQVRSMLRIPIGGKGTVLRYLCLDSVHSKKVWEDGQISLLSVVAHIWADAFAMAEQEKEINKMAYYDHLTGLPNRTLFKDRVCQAIYLAQRTQLMLAVMFLDLDSFKSVNDTMGHEAGDSLLAEVSQKISRSIRKSDTISRFGGDEFLLMINNIACQEDLESITQKIMALFERPFELNAQEFFITASAGIAVYPADGDDTDTLIKNADIAMYSAKAKGKNRYVFCSSGMKEDALMKVKLTNNLYRALERNEFIVHYQPQVSLLTGKVIGLEALIRWRHPEMGMISPGQFIPLAEQSGLIVPIGEWVLKTACSQNKAWQDAGLPPVRMAVNVSAIQFRGPSLAVKVQNALAETRLDPAFLELEITESAAIREAGYIIDTLNDLKVLGISISIDDFGTEYSSLGRLKLLPIDRIKMDMQFVRSIDGSKKEDAITRSIIHLAQALGVKVIAEGVETSRQLAFLCRAKCHEAQGFYYYRPMPAVDVEAVLRNHA